MTVEHCPFPQNPKTSSQSRNFRLLVLHQMDQGLKLILVLLHVAEQFHALLE